MTSTYLRHLPRLTDLSEELRDLVANGVGPRAGVGLFSRAFCGLMRLLILCTGLGALFDECADQHDLLYALGGTEDDRDLADVVFFLRCRQIKKKAPWYLHLAINLASSVLFDAVQAGGGFGPFTYRDTGPISIEDLIKEIS